MVIRWIIVFQTGHCYHWSAFYDAYNCSFFSIASQRVSVGDNGPGFRTRKWKKRLLLGEL